VDGLGVADVALDSELARAGLRAGDTILALDGLVPRDLIDLQLDLAGARRLLVQRAAGGREELRLSPPTSADGLSLGDPMPGGIRECNNHCEFCFIRGLPGGLRPSLYVFDDDYRYSFVWGTFLTLTNLTPADWDRIGYQRLSPLNVSVHATEPSVRRRLLNNRHAPDILPQLRRLGRLGVQVRAQVVLCAGINDGPVLEQTIADLAELHPTVIALAVVPVGLTRFSRVRNIRRPTQAEARAAVETCGRWQSVLRDRIGVRFVHPSDELRLLAGEATMPPRAAYDDFPLLTNGVGLMRSMLDDWQTRLARRRRRPSERPTAWLTGTLAAPALGQLAQSWEEFAGWRPRVEVVENRYFGEEVSVSGLLTGTDLVASLRRLPPEVEDVVLPRGAFGFEGGRTLDGLDAETVGAAHPGRVHLASTPAELLDILSRGAGRRELAAGALTGTSSHPT
jgi:putative radical SAM enzyme (TIGR03279 family)